jgi:hypothetical protein
MCTAGWITNNKNILDSAKAVRAKERKEREGREDA